MGKIKKKCQRFIYISLSLAYKSIKKSILKIKAQWLIFSVFQTELQINKYCIVRGLKAKLILVLKFFLLWFCWLVITSLFTNNSNSLKFCMVFQTNRKPQQQNLRWINPINVHRNHCWQTLLKKIVGAGILYCNMVTFQTSSFWKLTHNTF